MAKPKNTAYPKRATIQLTETDYQRILRSATRNNSNITEMLRVMIKLHIDEFLHIKHNELELKHIDIRNFKIDGYSEGLQ